jgi:hypothetical protein
LAVLGAYLTASGVFIVFMRIGLSQAGGMFIVVLSPDTREPTQAKTLFFPDEHQRPVMADCSSWSKHIK